LLPGFHLIGLRGWDVLLALFLRLLLERLLLLG
jgi:hypothetical protein